MPSILPAWIGKDLDRDKEVEVDGLRYTLNHLERLRPHITPADYEDIGYRVYQQLRRESVREELLTGNVWKAFWTEWKQRFEENFANIDKVVSANEKILRKHLDSPAERVGEGLDPAGKFAANALLSGLHSVALFYDALIPVASAARMAGLSGKEFAAALNLPEWAQNTVEGVLEWGMLLAGPGLTTRWYRNHLLHTAAKRTTKQRAARLRDLRTIFNQTESTLSPQARQKLLADIAAAESVRNVAADGARIAHQFGHRFAAAGYDAMVAMKETVKNADDLLGEISLRASIGAKEELMTPVARTRHFLATMNGEWMRQRRSKEALAMGEKAVRGSAPMNRMLATLPGSTANREEMVEMYHAAAPWVDDMLHKAKEFLRTADDELLDELVQRTPHIGRTMINTVSHSTEAGRTLEIHKHIDEGAQWFVTILEAMDEAYTKILLNNKFSHLGARAELAEFFKEMGTWATRDQYIVAMKKLNEGGTRLWPAFRELMRNVYLQSPLTWIRNGVGTAFGVLSSWGESFTGRILNATSMKDLRNLGSDTGAFSRGMLYSFSKNAKILKGIWQEDYLFNELSVVERGAVRLEAISREIHGLMGKVIRTPGRILVATDAVMQRMIRDAFLYETAEKAAREAAKKGYVRNAVEAKAFIADWLIDPKKVHANDWAAAIRRAREYTYTTPLGVWGSKAQALAQHGPLFAIFPFFRTPVNLYKFAIERTPLGFFSGNIRRAIEHGTDIERQAALGKLFAGQVYAMIFWEMAVNGMITPSRPANKMLARLEHEQGITPNALVVGGTVVPSNNFAPLSDIMTMWADLAANLPYADGDEQRESLVAAAIWATVRAAEDDTWLRGAVGLFDGIEAIQEGKPWPRVLEKVIEPAATGLVPGPIARQWATADDEFKRSVADIFDRFKVNSPRNFAEVPIDYNILGEPIRRPVGWWRSRVGDNRGGQFLDRFFGYFTSKPEEDPTLQWLEKLEVTPPPRRRRVLWGEAKSELMGHANHPEKPLGVPLTNEQEADIHSRRGTARIKGQSLRQMIEDLRTNPAMADNVPRQRTAAQTLINTFDRLGEITFTVQNPEVLTKLLKIREKWGPIAYTGPEHAEAIREKLQEGAARLEEVFQRDVLEERLPEFFPDAGVVE